MKTEFLLVIPAVISMIYGILVLRTGSGTGFFLVWFALGAGFLFLSYALHAHLLQRLPLPARAALCTALFVCLALFAAIEGMILRHFSDVPEKNLDYLIVLGAQVRETGPSVVLRYRLDAAYDYLSENPDTLCIVSGGQGYNEPFPESEGMKRYLVWRGIAGDRILMESASMNTRENMLFSMALFDPAADRVGIVTNDFHVFRALMLAEKAGITHVCAIPADSSPIFLPNNLLREFLGVLKDLAVPFVIRQNG